MGAETLLNSALSGRYEVEREIGSGGMATVYLARDVRHSRRVALKVLRPDLGAVLGVERFLSEIRVTANLQHPNLLPLFDSGDAEGLLFYVMPYIAGESLRSKLTREKQLPVDEAIHIATAVASALDYAHRHGVIHRDLKPQNILLHEGQPLVADFGIALAVSVAGGDRITQTGLSLGTPQYMSPEQAPGDRVIDGRTDVYSLGAVTYEMLTGEPPHTGSTGQAIIARILTEQVRSIRVTRASVPEHVDAAVMRALEKLPADRWHTAHDFAEALTGRSGVAFPSGARTPGALPSRRVAAPGRLFSGRALVIVGAFVTGSLLAAMATWQVFARPGGGPSLSFVIEPPVYRGVRQMIGDFALSPDGQAVALVAGSDSSSRVYLRRLSEPNAFPIPGTDNATFSAFSPDGTWLSVITDNGKLLKVRVDGTTAPVTLADGVDSYSGAAWAGDEAIVLGSARPSRRGLGRVAATGGAVRPLTAPTGRLSAHGHGFPFVAPDQRTVLFTDWGPGYTEDDFLAVGSIETGSYEVSSVLAYRPIGVADGRVLYTSGGSIKAVPFDARRLRVTGDPVRVLEGVTVDGRRSAALSSSGTLAYRRGQPTKRLVLLDRDGRTQALSSDERYLFGGRFSPDGQRVAVDVWALSGDTSAANIWTFDVKNRTFTRVTSLGNVVGPGWTSDGTGLVFTTWFQRKAALWLQAADGSQAAEKLLQVPDGVNLFQASATPDGRGVLFCQGWRFAAPAAKAELLYLPFAGERRPQRLVDEPMGNDCAGRLSPDGKWLAYVATEGGRSHVFVRRFRGLGGRVQISEGGIAVRPQWSRDGTRLFYAYVTREDGRTWVAAANVRSSGASLEVVNRERVVPLPQTSVFDVTPDGNRVLTIEDGDSRPQLVVMTNWFPQLRARLAGRQ
jgi:Tol biopolymer transport system component